jgi:hypothetical protein
MQLLTERWEVAPIFVQGPWAPPEKPNPIHLPRVLRLGGDRRKNKTESKNAASPIRRIDTSVGMAGGSLAERHDAH